MPAQSQSQRIKKEFTCDVNRRKDLHGFVKEPGVASGVFGWDDKLEVGLAERVLEGLDD